MPGRPPPRPLRVVLWGTYDTGKPRVRILRQGLRLQGAEVLECRADLWRGIDDKSQVRGARRWLKLAARALLAYPGLVWRYLRLPRHDVVLVAYPGLVDLFVLRPFAWLRRAPLAWDWFLSAYDTIVLDRRLLSPRNPLAWAIRAVEWLAARLADAVFMDTAAHATRMEHLFGLPAGAIGRVWVGVEREHFDGATGAARDAGDADGTLSAATPHDFTVLFYGQFIALHGIATIIAAADLLRDQPVHWRLIGRGQEAPRIRALLERTPLPRLQWIEWLDYRELRQALAQADVALGIFGVSDKAASVIPNKAFQILAARRPLITRNCAAIRELLDHAPPAVQLVRAGDAAALAAAVQIVVDQRMPNHPASDRATTAGAGVNIPDLTDRFDAAAVGRQLVDILQPLKRP